MKSLHIIWLLLTIGLVSACDLEGPQEECDYNARLLFHYSNGGSRNMIRDYVGSITDYIYNDRGKLVDVTVRDGVRVPQRTLTLAPGKYTLVSWGNLTEKTDVHPSQQQGTALEDMHLVQNNPHLGAATRFDPENMSEQKPADRLHYGLTEINVPAFGVAQQTVFMGHAYLDLTVTVVGLEGKPGDSFTMRLDGTHPVYAQTHYRHINAQGFDMYIPEPAREQQVPHLLKSTTMSRYGELENEFIAYRLTNETKPVFSVWQGGRQVLRNVDLKKFFDTMLIEMDTNECQEFHIRITVDGDNIYVQFVTLGDWIDGGSIG